MLLPQAFRQRFSLEVRTGRDIYSEELIENFLEDLCNVTPIKEKEIIIQRYSKVGLILVEILSKSAFLPSEVLNVVDYWFDPKEVSIL